MREVRVISRIFTDQSGQDIVEYGMLTALISIAAVITLRLFGPIVNGLYDIIVQAFGQ